MKNLHYRGCKDGALTKQSVSRGPLHPAAHSMWQQSLGLVPKQRPLHCGAHTVLVTERHRRTGLNRGRPCAWVGIVSLCSPLPLSIRRDVIGGEEGEGRRVTKNRNQNNWPLTDLTLVPVWPPAVISTGSVTRACGVVGQKDTDRQPVLKRQRQSEDNMGIHEKAASWHWPLTPLYWIWIGALLSLTMSCQYTQGPYLRYLLLIIWTPPARISVKKMNEKWCKLQRENREETLRLRIIAHILQCMSLHLYITGNILTYTPTWCVPLGVEEWVQPIMRVRCILIFFYIVICLFTLF